MGYFISVTVSSDFNTSDMATLISNIVEEATGSRPNVFIHDKKTTILNKKHEIAEIKKNMLK